MYYIIKVRFRCRDCAKWHQ